MTSSIPNSFNPDELARLMESAPQEAEVHAHPEGCGCPDCPDKDPDAIDAIANKYLDMAEEAYSSPVTHKVMAMKVICRMIEWHTKMGEEMIKDGEIESGVCWLRDAGKFQSIMNILTNISVGRDDYTCPED